MIYKRSENAILYSAAPVESLTKIIGKAVKAVFSCEENGFHDSSSDKIVARILSQSFLPVNHLPNNQQTFFRPVELLLCMLVMYYQTGFAEFRVGFDIFPSG